MTAGTEKIQRGEVMSFRVQKEIRWEAAHRLIKGYSGKCQFLHGHSWVARITVELRPGQELDAAGLAKDFGEFKAVQQWVEEHWDHGALVAQDDRAWLTWLRENGQKHFVFPDNPTSERIAETLFCVAAELLNDERCRVCRVVVSETPANEAVYEGK
ncbi:MAG TPA: 6-carboxytetrahydropterin synthase [Armatimonadetes bacterium]|nr:6-carboxytetrahydropterin synthase [Armatimonadota bacterium]